jgi:hypothetical protein
MEMQVVSYTWWKYRIIGLRPLRTNCNIVSAQVNNEDYFLDGQLVVIGIPYECMASDVRLSEAANQSASLLGLPNSSSCHFTQPFLNCAKMYWDRKSDHPTKLLPLERLPI